MDDGFALVKINEYLILLKEILKNYAILLDSEQTCDNITGDSSLMKVKLFNKI